jgi:hypothetical protein
MLKQRGDVPAARALLAASQAQFEEGQDTHDLRIAAAFMRSLDASAV